MPRTFYGPYGSQYNTHAEPAPGNTGLFPLGSKLVLADEREYRYTLNDGNAEIAGDLYESIAPDSAHGGTTGIVADVARAVGAVAISGTLGASAAAVDLYSEGLVTITGVTVATGQGFAFRIARAIAAGQAHAAVLSSGIITVNLEAGESVQVALTTSSEMAFTRNRWDSVVLKPGATAVALPAGVAPIAAGANRYYYGQTRGLAAVLQAASVLIGDPAVGSTGTAGAVMPSAAFHTDGPNVGTCALVVSTADYCVLDLTIA